MPSRTYAAFRLGLVWAMGLLVAAYTGVLVLHGAGLSPLVVNALGLMAVWVSAAVCWLAVSRVGFRTWEVLLAASAVTSYAVGLAYYAAVLAGGGSLSFPTPTDLINLLFYPLMLAALILSVRHQVRGLGLPVCWDAAVGSLGAAAVLAVVLHPLESALVGSSFLATVAAVGPPMFDVLLAAAVVGVAALPGVRAGSRWTLLVVGLLAFTAADVVYALQVSEDTFVVGTPLEAGWAVGLALVAMWVDGTAQRDRPSAREAGATTRSTAMVVPTLSMAAGVGVLAMSGRTSVPVLAVVLAGVTLLAALARTQAAFHQLARMADLRQLAAGTDELTGLPNRRALYDQGHARLAEPLCRRQALLMLDLDKFKEVNDTLGHHVGDELLVEVAARLREHVRGGDLLARLGGDEFAVLLPDAGRHEAVDVAVKLRAALDEAFTIQGLALHSRVSIGIALFPDGVDDSPDLSALLRKADIAMYQAKTSSTGHHLYSGTGHADGDNAARRRTVAELRTALTNDQLVVAYQPKIDLDTGQVHGVEALVRWEHPTRGLLYPDAFLALVEESGLMPTLTRAVLAAALDQVALWRAKGQELTVAVNLSTTSLFDADLPDQVAVMLAARGIPPNALQLEITEEFLMADRDRARSILNRLRDSGVQISVDDYGAGYSSLSHLRDMPIDELKLDPSVVLPMADDAWAAALVASTIDLAHSLGLRMVAEGVETEAAYTELTHLGCDQAQGYFLSRPVPAADLDQWLNNRRALGQSTDLPQPLPTVAG